MTIVIIITIIIIVIIIIIIIITMIMIIIILFSWQVSTWQECLELQMFLQLSSVRYIMIK